MRIRTAAVSATALVVVAALLALAPSPVGAQADPCPPGQPLGRPAGTPPGPPGSPPGQPADRPPQYPPGKCQLRLSRSVVAVGGSVAVAGAGFARSSEVRLAVAGVGLGAVTADPAGSFATDVVIPAAVAPGAHELTASGAAAAGGGARVLAATLTVTGARASRGAAQEGGALPRTGGGDGVGPLSVVALALLAAGTAAVLATRRRLRSP